MTSASASMPEVRGGGGVVWRLSPSGSVEVVLVHHSIYAEWSLPKGKQDPGEELVACALREVAEETGLSCSPGERVATVHYVDRMGRPKAVHYWSMEPRGVGDIDSHVSMEPQGAGDIDSHVLKPTMEIDDARWVRLDEAITEVELPRDRTVLIAFAGYLGCLRRQEDCMVPGLGGARSEEIGAPKTAASSLLPDPNLAKGVTLGKQPPLLLVRHASAGDRSLFEGDDTKRPLDARGEQDARRLAETLSFFPVEQIVSSPAVRCLDTVQPLARRLGLAVECDDALAEGRTHGAGDLLDRYRQKATVLCTHGDVMEAALASVRASSRLPVPGDGALKKACTWVLCGNGNAATFKVASYLPPPARI